MVVLLFFRPDSGAFLPDSRVVVTDRSMEYTAFSRLRRLRRDRSALLAEASRLAPPVLVLR